MDTIPFLQDLAVTMIVAGAVTLLFRRLRQPVVLGYLLAGFIIGPYTPPFPLVRDEQTIRILADLGVVVLMFALGLEFNLRKLHEVGRPAFGVAAIEIPAMVMVGYELGYLLGWPVPDRVLLGIMLALTSTTIVIKSLRDRGELQHPYGRLISGVSIYDDIFVILVMVVLPGVARTGSLPAGRLALTLLALFVFLVAALVAGLLLVPRLVGYVARFRSDEMLLVLSLGLCFGMALLAVKLQFSAALGAFLMGGILAETREHGRIASLIAPIRDMFSAIFFVAMGMLIDPAYVARYAGPVLLITAVYLVAKVAACAGGTLAVGYPPRDALRVGTGMAQVGEFAIILAAIAGSLGLASEHLSAVIVSVVAVNALVRPYLVGGTERIADALGRRTPRGLHDALTVYARWMARGRALGPHAAGRKAMRSVAWQIALNMALVAGLFVGAAWLVRMLPLRDPAWSAGVRALAWLAALLCTLPIQVATARKLEALALMTAELTVPAGTPRAGLARDLIVRVLAGLGIAGQILCTLLLSVPLLPPWPFLILAAAAVVLLVWRHGQSLNRWYSKAKFSLVEAWSNPPAPAPAPLPALLREARTERVAAGAAAGRLIRELALRTRSGASIIAIERGGRTLVNPGPDEELAAGDQLLLLGSEAQLAEARRLLQDGADGALSPPPTDRPTAPSAS